MALPALPYTQSTQLPAKVAANFVGSVALHAKVCAPAALAICPWSCMPGWRVSACGHAHFFMTTSHSTLRWQPWPCSRPASTRVRQNSICASNRNKGQHTRRRVSCGSMLEPVAHLLVGVLRSCGLILRPLQPPLRAPLLEGDAILYAAHPHTRLMLFTQRALLVHLERLNVLLALLCLSRSRMHRFVIRGHAHAHIHV
jgi:hypothetical protein